MIRIHFKAVLRKPTLLEDFHFREKITHFDHARIHERAVHAALLDSAKLDNSVPGMITVNEENCSDALKTGCESTETSSARSRWFRRSLQKETCSPMSCSLDILDVRRG